MFSPSYFHWKPTKSEDGIFWVVKKQLLFKPYSPHCFATIQASKNDKNVAWHNDHRPLHKMTPFRTWPYFIRPWANSPPNKEKLVMFGSPLGHLWNLPGTPRPLHWPPLTSLDPKRTPQGPPGITKTIRKPQILRMFKKRQGFPSKLIDLDLTNHENVNISLDH